MKSKPWIVDALLLLAQQFAVDAIKPYLARCTSHHNPYPMIINTTNDLLVPWSKALRYLQMDNHALYDLFEDVEVWASSSIDEHGVLWGQLALALFLISLKAGGTGLNLTEADTVIHLEPWWNPAVEDQARVIEP